MEVTNEEVLKFVREKRTLLNNSLSFVEKSMVSDTDERDINYKFNIGIIDNIFKPKIP